jgi:hypothetical protein
MEIRGQLIRALANGTASGSIPPCFLHTLGTGGFFVSAAPDFFFGTA